MSVAVAVTPASGSITHLTTAIHVAVTGASANNASAYDSTIYPTEPAYVYKLQFVLSGHDSLTSPLFSPGEDGTAQWDGIILPAAGTWTLNLVDTSDDSTTATASVVVV